jgi:transmembrane sensor
MTDDIYQQAALWLTCQDDGAMDWAGFTAWLEADPRHRAAYDELALIDSDIDEHSRQISNAFPANDSVAEGPVRRAGWGPWAAGFGGAAIAAGAALFVVGQPAFRTAPAQDYRSVAGSTLSLALNDGSRVVLAPVSDLQVRGNQLALNGTAYFDVPHQPGRRLEISAGDFTVTDIGTRFSVDREAGSVTVDVASGSVAVTSPGLAAPVSLSAGHGLRADLATGTVRLVGVDPQQVASWRSGRLQFDDAPLTLVAHQISRYSGTRITVDPAIADQPFSGVIAINHGEAAARNLAQILSLEVRKVDGGLRLEHRHR